MLRLSVIEHERYAALNALSRLKTELSTDVLRNAFKQASGDFKLEVAARLLARNDISGLPPVTAALLAPNGVPASVIADMSGSLTGIKDNRAVPALSSLVGSPNQLTRIGAVIALRQTASLAALEPLSRALADSNREVRYNAVAGMGEITRQDEWTPSIEEFNERETRYLSYWRNWATANVRSQ